MHLTFHRKLDRTLFSFENASSQQNPFYEWQANEGAAELLVPYKDFIPKYIEVAKRVRRVPTYKSDINDELAPIYGVTDYVINNRIKNLQYEIYQYKNGVPLDELVILSKRKQEEYGIFVDPTALCCNFCNAIALEADNFCHICGKEFIQQGWWDKTHPSRTRSVASMIYQGIDIDENGRMKKCSVCENEEITSGDFCMICGSNLINECENEECNCTAHLPGNARYCPQCGHETSFSKAGYLSKWNTEEQTIETDIYDEMMPF
jgi:hypothetical protein